LSWLSWSNLFGGAIGGIASWFFVDFVTRPIRHFRQMRAEIFERILAATRTCTTILVSHRFSTVRHADKIAVVADGKVVELGSHAQLMELDGRYCRMFTLQAQRFASGAAEEGEEETVFDVLA